MDNQPIAIIGMAGRFPQANNITELWSLLSQGKEAFSDYPSDRWKHDSLLFEGEVKPGHTYCPHGGFIMEGDKFDAGFFGIKNEEAIRMDPQQGVMLESVWHALEDAMIAPSSIKGTDTGVFFGVSTRDYDRRLSSQISELDLRASTGACGAVVANRTSYTFGLTGPSITIDSACASSLSAIHYAVQSLMLGESSMAITGGIHLILSPANIIAFSQGKVLSSQGHCKSFGEGSDGYIFGEGCGVILLKKLADAERDGNKVWAVIKGSANNHNGLSNGLGSPYGPAQKKVMESALQRANLSPDKIDYIEAHGTGSFIGDAVEVNAIKQVYGQRSSLCYIGSIKSNVGHLEACAGVAGLIKTVLSIKNETITQSLHTKRINKHLKMNGTNLAVAQSKMSWKKKSDKRHAAVSSFGFGGANVHMIVSEYKVKNKKLVHRSVFLLLSAKTASALKNLLSDYKMMIEGLSEEEFENSVSSICVNSCLAREHLNYRVAIKKASKEEMLKDIIDLVESFSLFGEKRSEVSELFFSDVSFSEFRNSDVRDVLLSLSNDLGAMLPREVVSQTVEALALLVFLKRLDLLPDFVRFEKEVARMVIEALHIDSVSTLVLGARLKESSCQIGTIDECGVETGVGVENQLLSYIKNAYICGKNVNWKFLNGGIDHDVNIPLYAFERSRYWEIPESKPGYRI